jgi:hypothetical protein
MCSPTRMRIPTAIGFYTTVKVAADWAPDSASDSALDWASHSAVFNHSKVDHLTPFFLATFKVFLLAGAPCAPDEYRFRHAFLVDVRCQISDRR